MSHIPSDSSCPADSNETFADSSGPLVGLLSFFFPLLRAIVVPPLRAIYQSIRIVRRILMRPLRNESDRWLLSSLNFRSASRVLWLQISPYYLLQTPPRVLLVYTTSLYIVLFYSLNKSIILSALLVTLVLFVKCPTVTTTKYLPEPMETFPVLLPLKSS